jgi:outer membrane protein OmpU
MNKLKKIGLTALAGSLVATSAFAGEMAVGGSAKATWTDKEAGSITGNGIGMNKLLTFTGSGDLDSGHTISVYFANNGTSQSSAYMTYDMGDMGSLTLDNGAGGHGIGSIDDMTPTANEEIWDNISYGTGHDGFRVGAGNAGAIAYKTTLGGIGISADYLKQGGGTLEDGATGAAGTGTSQSIALTTSIADGLNVGIGFGDVGTGNESNDQGQNTQFVTYAVGGATLGAQRAEESSNGSTWVTMQWGVSFNVSDNISVGYGQRTVDMGSDSTLVDEEDSGFSASYTMGSMSVKANINKADDMKGTAGSDKETTEVAVSFAF